MKINFVKYIGIFILIGMLSSCQSGNTNNPLDAIKNIISDPKDDLIGFFAEKEGGKAMYKIYKENGKYFLFMEGSPGIKSETEELVDGIETAPNKLKQKFGDDWESYVEAALVMKAEHSFGFFKVKKGYEYKGHTFTTGYYAQFWGGGDAYKVSGEDEIKWNFLPITEELQKFEMGENYNFRFKNQVVISYNDESKNGFITIDQNRYILNGLKRVGDSGYEITGKDIVIKIPLVNWKDEDGGDCSEGIISSLFIYIEGQQHELNNLVLNYCVF